MNVLIIGSGAREHALAWKIKQSPRLTNLFIAPGNAGTKLHGTNIDIAVNDFAGIKNTAIDKQIGMVVVGPEAPLAEGIHDYFIGDPQICHIPLIGPQKRGAMLEGSKDFAKQFMKKYNIPTAASETFGREEVGQAIKFLQSLQAPYVLKADGLAAGKGVIITESVQEAEHELRAMLEKGKFGTASEKIIIEEYLSGIELSAFILTDGKSYVLLPEAKDYKRIGEGDTGLNTGGMGSISPVPFVDAQLRKKIEDRIIKPTITGLQAENIPYKGFIFFGIMNVEGNPYVIEYNVRLGDPEAESIIPRIQNDLLDLFEAVAANSLEKQQIAIDSRSTASIMLVAGGYPEAYEKNKNITGLNKVNNSMVFHAGTRQVADTEPILTNGGRVLAVTSFGDTMQEALKKSYQNAEIINFEGKNYRKDLGADLKNFIKKK